MNNLLTSRLCTALMRIGTKMAAGFDQHFAFLGLTQAQFRFLLAVWEEGGSSGIAPSRLAEHLLIERASVSVLASALVERGLIERRPGENRRSHRLALTAAGGVLLQQAVPIAIQLADHTLSGMVEAQFASLAEQLGRIEANLRAPRSPED